MAELNQNMPTNAITATSHTRKGNRMEKEYISTADTAKLVRQCLKESFPQIKFTVRSSVYSGGSNIRIGWTDGPTEKQINEIVSQFAGSGFDSMVDLKYNRYAEFDGKPVSFGADYIFTNRNYSDTMIESAIAAIQSEFGCKNCPTVEDYKEGRAYQFPVIENNHSYPWEFQSQISKTLCETSLTESLPSKTANRTVFTHDDSPRS